MTGDMVRLGEGARHAAELAAGADPGVEMLATVIVAETLVACGRGDEGDAMLDRCDPFLLHGDPLAGLPEVIGKKLTAYVF